MLLIFQVVSGAAWAVYRLMQDTPVRYTRNSNHMHKCDHCIVDDFAQETVLTSVKPCYNALRVNKKVLSWKCNSPKN